MTTKLPITTSYKIIFMGTPDFAVPSLLEIINSKHEVVAVFTQKPKPKGRGMEITLSPVHAVASQHNLPVYTPEKLRNEDSFELIKSIEADLIVVAAYGFIIPKNILESKKYGCINLHPSRLPRFRGAAPLQHTIIEGDEESSICIIKMDEGLDTGPILLQKDFKLPERPILKWLHDYCSIEGAKMVVDVLDNIESVTTVKQTEESAIYASKLSKEDSNIDWKMDAFKIDAKIRGYAVWPGSFTKIEGIDVKIIDTEPILQDHNNKPGSVLDNKNLVIACGENSLKINIIQPQNKKPMSGTDFLNGYKINRLES